MRTFGLPLVTVTTRFCPLHTSQVKWSGRAHQYGGFMLLFFFLMQILETSEAEPCEEKCQSVNVTVNVTGVQSMEFPAIKHTRN